jgi:recombination DNA repair RAD52 pathway protein
MTNEDTPKTLMEMLTEPFGPDEVKQRKGRGGGMYDYIDARSAHQRLDRIFGPTGWDTSYKVIDADAKAVECTLRVCWEGIWASKSDVGYCNAADDADNDAAEPYKAAYSDALKRAAVQLGIGRHLYEKTPPAAAQRPREAPASTPLTKTLLNESALRAEMAAKGVNGADLARVIGANPPTTRLINKWLEDHPDLTQDDLVDTALKLALDAKANAESLKVSA